MIQGFLKIRSRSRPRHPLCTRARARPGEQDLPPKRQIAWVPFAWLREWSPAVIIFLLFPRQVAPGTFIPLASCLANSCVADADRTPDNALFLPRGCGGGRRIHGKLERRPGLVAGEVSGFGCCICMLTKGLFWGRDIHRHSPGFLSEAAGHNETISVDCVTGDLFGRCGTRLLSHESVGNLALFFL